MRVLSLDKVLVLFSCLVLAACGGGDTSSSSTTTTTSGSSTSDTASAVLHTGALGGDVTYPVINHAFSVLDENGAPLDNLDGGDFIIEAGLTDFEAHYSAQKIDFTTHVTGQLVLMLDVSNDMAPRFTELQTAAKRLVDQAIALGLPVTVYTFSDTGSVVPATPFGVATNVATATTLKANIDLLTPQLGNTYFYEAVAAVVTDRVGINGVLYGHNPTTVPFALVELMVVMSDGRESPGTTNTAAEVTTAKDKRYWIHSIAIGNDPDVDGALSTISDFAVSVVPDGGTYSDAVDSAMTAISNYYNGFYLLDYQPTDLTSASATYNIKLVDNDTTSINVTYDGTTLPATWIPPVCCEVWAGPGDAVDISAVSIDAGSSMDFQVVELWSNMLNTASSVQWSLANSDGNMLLTCESTMLVCTIDSVGLASTGTLTVSVDDGVLPPWNQVIPITVAVP